MARISTYAAIAATAQDTLLGTDVSSGLATKNYTVQSIVDLIPGIVPGGGTVTTVGINVIGDAYIGTVVNPTTTPAIAVTPQGTASQYINGLGNLITFPAGGGISLAVDRTSGASTLVGSILNIPNYLNDASIVKTSGVQTIAGAKTFTSNIIANNITNDNTGDQSLSIAGNTLTISGTSSSVTLPTGGTVTSLSVTGASGAAATLISGVLNIPTPVIPTVNFTSLATVGTSGAATLISGVLIKRYKRFFADVKIKDKITTAHCPNTGSMMGLSDKKNKAWISKSNNLKRKLKYTLQVIEVNKKKVGVNTHLTNKIVLEALQNNFLKQFSKNAIIKTEQSFGTSTRFDFLIIENEKKSFIEVKNVTLSRKEKLAEFPDAITTRGAKHIKDLIKAKKQGFNSYLLFVVQREDCNRFAIAKDIDPEYSKLLTLAYNNKVKILCYDCKFSSKDIKLNHQIKLLNND